VKQVLLLLLLLLLLLEVLLLLLLPRAALRHLEGSKVIRWLLFY
jgi:hypothetical protein